jgi:hypothetical protein
LLPKRRGVEIIPFELTDDDMKHGVNIPVDAVTGIPSDKRVRLVLTFLTDKKNPSLKTFTDALRRRYGCTDTVIAGGYGCDGYDVITSDSIPTRYM